MVQNSKSRKRYSVKSRTATYFLFPEASSTEVPAFCHHSHRMAKKTTRLTSEQQPSGKADPDSGSSELFQVPGRYH